MKSPEAGGKRYEGLSLLKGAAEKGHLEAQALYGATKFTDLMTTSSEPELRDQYVDSLYFLALAAKRGSASAEGVLPQLETLSLGDEGEFTEPLAEPLTHLEEGWVKAALEKAQDELSCYAK
jgi:TPR repeat protein